MFPNVGPSGRPMPSPSVCSYSVPLKIKNVFRTACVSSCWKMSRVRLKIKSVLVNSWSIQIEMVSWSGMLVNRDSMSKEAM